MARIFRTPYKNRSECRIGECDFGKSITDPSHVVSVEKLYRTAMTSGNYLGRGQFAFDISPDMSLDQAEKQISLIDKRGFDLSDIPPYLERVKQAYNASLARLEAEKKSADAAAAAKSGEAITQSNGSDAGNQPA